MQVAERHRHERNHFGLSARTPFAASSASKVALQPLIRDGHVLIEDQVVTVTEAGRSVIASLRRC
jgi:hypothetical protein